MNMITEGDPTTSPSFSINNRLARLIWSIVWFFWFRPSPRVLHGWRSFLLRLFGARIGQNVHIYPSVKIWAPWNLHIEDGVGIGDGTRLYSMDLIHIGERAVVSQNSHLCAGSHDINSPRFQLITKPIHIGAKVWICADAFVGPGVHITEGCVIGARGVVFKSINQPWSVWGGNPATHIKQRAPQ